MTLEALPATLAHFETELAKLDAEIARRAKAKEDELARRLMAVPGIGPLIASAIAALTPTARKLAEGAPFCALAEPGAVPAFDWRQEAAWCHEEDGRALPEAVADYWGQRCHHQTTHPLRRPAGNLNPTIRDR